MEIEAERISGVMSMTRGLMFSKKRNVLFDLKKYRKEGVHTWFLFFKIDVYYMDKEYRVLEFKKRMKPFSVYFPNAKARYILETPDKQDIHVGEIIKIKNFS